MLSRDIEMEYWYKWVNQTSDVSSEMRNQIQMKWIQTCRWATLVLFLVSNNKEKEKKTKYSNIRRHLLIRRHVNNLRQLDRCGGITWLDIQEQPFTSLLLPSFSSLYIGCLALIAFSSRMSSLGLPILSDFSWFTYCVARNFSSLFAVSPLN